jgi:hypothetical protein
VYLQQKWVKHWIDKELNRGGRSEVRYQSNPSTGEKRYRYEEWGSHVAAVGSGPEPQCEGKEEGEGGRARTRNELAIYPRTLFVDKCSGDAVEEGGNTPPTCGNNVITVQNHADQSQSIHVEASSSVLIQEGGGGDEKNKDFEIKPHSCIR